MSEQRNIGTRGETAIARVFQANGWPSCERRTLNGALDRGDLTGIPGICVEVKSGETARRAPNQPALIRKWMAETEVERRNAHADFGILVIRRGGFGDRNAHLWWAVIPWRLLHDLNRPEPTIPTRGYPEWIEPAFVELATLFPILWRAGYGTAPEVTP